MISRNVHRFAAVRRLGFAELSGTMRSSGISIMLAALWVCASGPQITAQTPAINPPATTFSSLFSFDGTDGEAPRAALVQGADGNFYGTTVEGGANCAPSGCGTIFKVAPSGAQTVLHSFDGTDGSSPNGLI